MPVACRMARPTVMYRVHWVIFFWPTAPCFCHCSIRGMTTASSCMMIELVMYGMIPRAKTAIWVRAPPENRFRKLSTPPWLACFWSCWTAGKLIPGTVTFAPSRYRAMMNSVNRILFRRSGIRNMFRKLESTGRLLPLAVGQSVALRRRSTMAERRRKDLNATACRSDGLLGGLGEGVGLHGHLAGELTAAEDLHQAVLVDEALGPQVVGIDVGPFEGLECVEVDDGVLDPEGVLEAL